jgi:hypothetical protein
VSSTKAQRKPAKASKVKPKKKCCVSTPRCQRCPVRMLKAGTLPEGYTVKKRKLVKLKKSKRSKKSRRPIAA